MKKLKGIRRKGRKWQVYVKVGGEFVSTTFDDLDVPKMRAWQEQQASVARSSTKGTLAWHADDYFNKPEIKAQTYVHQKRAHVDRWLELLGRDTLITAITRDHIESIIQAWLTTLAEPTVYHRRSALLAVFTHVFGSHTENVVMDTTVPNHWLPRDQSVDYVTLNKILEAMPAERYVRRGIRQPSIARLVAAVLKHTGIRPCDLARVQRTDVNWQLATIDVPGSDKGQGSPPWTCYMTDEGVIAMRAFDAANAYGAFKPAAVTHSYKRAARRVLGPDTKVHLYSQRHSIGADALRETGDYVTVGHLLGHTDGSRMAEQYALGARAEVDRRAVAALGAARRAALAAAQAPAPEVAHQPAATVATMPAVAQKLPKKLPTRRKSHKRAMLRRVG